MLYSLENESFAVLECEKEALSDLPREVCFKKQSSKVEKQRHYHGLNVNGGILTA